MKTLLLLFFAINTAFSAEIDSHSGTDNFVWSASGTINKEITGKLKAAAEEINNQKIKCSEKFEKKEDIYEIVKEELKKDISHFFIGHFIAEHFHLTLPENKKIIIPFEESVYREISFLDGISLKLKGTLGLIKVNGHFHMLGANYIGMDKLGHFFVEGFDFFDRAYLDEDGTVEKAIEWGQGTERGKFGLFTTGVYSHADLIANFNGMRFWNQILMIKKDPLQPYHFYHKKPFYKCRNNKWVLNKNFDLNNYTDSAWDEKINCNKYRNPEIEGKVIEAFSEAVDAEDWDNFCPAIQSRCDSILKKYSDFRDSLISPRCK